MFLKTNLVARTALQMAANISLESRISVSRHFIGLWQDIDRVLQELEEERKNRKELAQAKAKLSGMLKTGQDALREEQDNVRQLQEQLEKHSKVQLSHVSLSLMIWACSLQ